MSLLVGSDQMWRTATGDTIRCNDVNGLVSENTTLGWTLQGPFYEHSMTPSPQQVKWGVLQMQVLQRVDSHAGIHNACPRAPGHERNP